MIASKNKRIYLLIGTNLGDRHACLQQARSGILQTIGKIVRQSSVYESSPWGFESDLPFLNQALEVDTFQTPFEVLREILALEASMGRVRKSSRYISRTIDIDILLFGDLRIEHPELQVPHPRLHERRFAMVPLCELIPDMIHPQRNLSMAALLEACSDEGWVRLFSAQ